MVWSRPAVDFSDLLKLFWECHDPTQGDRQGNDTGTQYRSAIYTTTEQQMALALASRDAYQAEQLASVSSPLRSNPIKRSISLRRITSTPRSQEVVPIARRCRPGIACESPARITSPGGLDALRLEHQPPCVTGRECTDFTAVMPKTCRTALLCWSSC